MFRFSVRRLALACALAVTVTAAAAGSAQAAVTASTISSPAANSYFFYEYSATSTTLFTLTGTTTGTGNVDIDCYDGTGTVHTIATNVTVTSNAFSVPVTTAELDSAGIGSATCVLRAVDTGDSTDYAPGSASPFAGPAIAISEKIAYLTGSGATYDFDYYLSDFSGYLDFVSPGDCGLIEGELYAAGTITPSSRSFGCFAGLYDPDAIQNGTNFGGGIKIDGVEALDSDSANFHTTGYQGITLSESFSGGVLTIHDDEPILVCVPSYATCNSYESSGVELDRTWQTADDGKLALQTDVFRSVDGKPHTVSVLEDDAIAGGYSSGSSFLFPASSGWQDYPLLAMVPLPAGSGVIYFKNDSLTPDAGDGVHPQGAIVYASTTTSPVEFSSSDGGGSTGHDAWVMPYTRTVPAGGSAALRFGYVQDYSLSSVQSLAAAARATFNPVVSISAPANGATVTAPTVTVSGTVSDPTGITSVTVNGHAATVGSGGTFTASVPLSAGANTITAIATDGDGITGQKQITLTSKNPPAVTTGAASNVKASSAKIAGTVNPEGQATTYAVQYGKTAAYGSTSAIASAGSGSSAVPVSSTLAGLNATTSYYYRVIATSAGGTSYGSDRTFRTGKPAPTGLGTMVTGTSPHFTVKGKLGLPRGISKKKGCAGTITIKVKHGHKTVATKHAKITKKCTWKGSVAASGKLKITPSFGGNSVLAGLTGKPLHAG